jgi:hypothetical protein
MALAALPAPEPMPLELGAELGFKLNISFAASRLLADYLQAIPRLRSSIPRLLPECGSGNRGNRTVWID